MYFFEINSRLLYGSRLCKSNILQIHSRFGFIGPHFDKCEFERHLCLIYCNLFELLFRSNRTVPNDLRFRLFMHFKKVSRKKTVFNQSHCRKFEKCLFAQWDYFWIFWAKRLFSNFLPIGWLKTVSFTKNSLWDKISID